MSSASSAVTYISIYTDSEPGRVFWGADEELSDGGSPRVIVYGYDGLPLRPVAPPSPDYISGLKEPQTPPVPQDDNERKPMFIQPHDPDYMPEPMYPKSDPEEDPKEYEDDETEDGPVDYPIDGGDNGDDDGNSSRDDADNEDEDEEEEEHLALADSAIVIPTIKLVSPPEGTEPIIPPPSANTTTTGARITVQLQAAISLPPETLRMASTQALTDAVTTTLPLLPLPPPLYIPPPVKCRDDIPESEMPPRKRLCLSTLGSRYEIGESSTAKPTGEVGSGIRDTWVDPTEAVLEIALMTVGERVNLLMEDRTAHQETILIIEEEAYALREAWAHLIGLSQAVNLELQTYHKQAQMVETPRVMRDMTREMGDMQAELLALREQPRRARQPGEDARVPNHQDAPRDADIHMIHRI
nr:hypothetical protein [Tanacetum cinerariifolium]